MLKSLQLLLAVGIIGYTASPSLHHYGSMVINDEEGTEYYIPNNINILKSCSNKLYFCVFSEGSTAFLNVSTPRICVHPKVGMRWGAGSHLTTVKGRISSSEWLLSTDVSPEGAYGYNPKKGITNIYWDPNGDAVSRVLNQADSSLDKVATMPLRATDEPIGKCKKKS